MFLLIYIYVSVFRNMREKGSAQEQSNVVFFSGYCCKPDWPSGLQQSAQLLNIVRASNFTRCNNRCSLWKPKTKALEIFARYLGEERPSRYLPDIWTKRGPRDIWAKAVREGVGKKRFLCCANLHQQAVFQRWQWFIPTKICQHKSAQWSILTKRIIYTVFWPDSVRSGKKPSAQSGVINSFQLESVIDAIVLSPNLPIW